MAQLLSAFRLWGQFDPMWEVEGHINAVGTRDSEVRRIQEGIAVKDQSGRIDFIAQLIG